MNIEKNDNCKLQSENKPHEETTMSDRLLPIYNKPHIEFVKWADPYRKDSKPAVEEEENMWGEERPQQAFFTPFGHISLNCPIDLEFSLYIGHTNFFISHKIMSAIENTEGVETFDLFSPYRFRVGVARLFLARDVFRGIRKNVRNTLKKNKIQLKD